MNDLLRGASFSYTLSGSTVSCRYSDAMKGKCGEAEASWTCRELTYGSLLHLTLRFPSPVTLGAFVPLVMEIPAEPVLRAALMLRCDTSFADVVSGLDAETEQVYLFRDGEGLLAHSVYPERFIERFRIRCSGETTSLQQNVLIPESFSSCVYESSDIYVARTEGQGTLSAALDEYNSLLPQLWHGQQAAVGYNTWDYYASDISEECVRENLEFIAGDPILKKNLRYFTLDDGWEDKVGDWMANRRFPHDLAGTAELIRSYGLTPGIWIAPTHVATDSAYAQRRMEGFLADVYGDPITEGNNYVLDPTHPAARRRIKELFARLYDAGFRSFKVDFVGSLINIKRFYDPSAGNYDAMRTLFSDIRSVVKDSPVLGCSLPPEAASPDADSGRTGTDIHTKWSHIRWEFEDLQFHWGDSNRIWINDPDFLIIRGPDTDRDPQRNVLDPAAHAPSRGRWRSGPDSSLCEARTQAAMVLLAGGSVNLSDRLSMLNEEGLGIVHKVLSSRVQDPAHPLDAFTGDRASVWKQVGRIFLLNFEDTERTLSFASASPFRDLWTGRVFAPESGNIRVALRPHESAVLDPV